MCDILFQNPERLLGDFFLEEVVSDHIFDELANVLISSAEIFIEFIGDHLSKLFSLLDGLGLFDGGV